MTEKVSLTLDADLLAEARKRSDNLSALVNEALEMWMRNNRLGEFLDELDKEFGPVPEDVQEQARQDMERARRKIEAAQAQARRRP
jgi:post-segregation antitoxin CcdA